jgi:1-aminocyclopropane-1-carboxylate deaminase/D-cysteine desulfhydrase-like pyridoxal-dependent ACC family enzyme
MIRENELRKAIAQLPRVALGAFPTPLDALPRLAAAVGAPPIYMKRDDLTGLAFGGNKTRMLEFSLADAITKGADAIVTGMAVQSNYCRQLAAACAKVGLPLYLVLRPVREIDRQQVQGNHLLQRLFGAHVQVLPDNDRNNQQLAVAATADRLRAAGKRVYIPRQPETVDLDAIAYIESVLEMQEQCRSLGVSPGVLYLAAADTTQAGVVLAMKFLQNGVRVRGINPFEAGDERVTAMLAMARQAATRLGLEVDVDENDFDNDTSYVGERYGIPTPAGLAALHLVARQEGILLDPVYTSKAMAALISDVEQGRVPGDAPILFLHTGGAPALFAYAEEVIATMPETKA